MDIRITPAKLSGAITPPPSKSQAHRLLIAAALAAEESTVFNVAFSRDITATIRCLEQLGAEFRADGNTLHITGMGANRMSPLRRLAFPQLDCGESGSTLRFLIPVALAVRAGGVFTGQGRLMERPLDPYAAAFTPRGIVMEREHGTLTVSGALVPGAYEFPGNVSSQFITGMLYALPLLAGDSTVTLTTPLESRGYVDMTLDALKKFGIDIREEGDRFLIPGNQTYQPRELSVEADWSQAGFYYAAFGLRNDVDVEGMDFESIQGDRIIISHCLMLRGLGEVELDVSQCPDLVPALAVRAALREGQITRIVNAARLRIKESDRLDTVATELNKLGADIEQGPDSLTIRGVGALHGGTVDSHNDHRIAMMLAIAATCASEPVTVLDAGSVAKSYPDFWADYRRLGGQAEEL